MRVLASLLARWPVGLRVATAIYLAVRLPIEVVAVGTLGMLPAGPGLRGMPAMQGAPLLQAFLRWDSGWYVRIIEQGFSYADCTQPGPCAQASIAFLPSFPLMVRAVMQIGLALPTASFLVTHVALLLAIWGMWELARLRGGDQALANRAAIAMLAFPAAFFLSAGYAEPLFMAAGIWGVVFLERRQLWSAAAALSIGLLTRSHGMLLVGAVGLVLLARRDWKAVFIVGGACALTLALYLGWQHATFGDALAFVHARRGWGVVDKPALELAGIYWQRTVSGELFWEGWLDFASIPWLIAVTVLAWRHVGRIEALYCALVLLAPLWTGQIWALSRIALCAFPAYLVAARWASRPFVAWALFSTGTAFVVTSALRFVNGLHAGS